MGQAPSKAPSLSFSPALESHCLIFIPPNAFHDQDDIKLILNARLRVKEAEQLAREGWMIQAYTNAPVQGRAGGKWMGYTFEQRCCPPRRDFSVSEPGDEDMIVLPLVEASVVGRSEDDFHVPMGMVGLRLQLMLCPVEGFQEHSEIRFGMTYRFMRSNGECTWLGNSGQDISYVIKQGDLLVAVSKTWVDGSSVNPQKGVRVLEHHGTKSSESDGPGDVHVGQVTYNGEWGCWALSDERYVLVQYWRQFSNLRSNGY